MSKVTVSNLNELKTALNNLAGTMANETSTELVIVTSQAFDIFTHGTHSFTFHKLASTYFWAYGYLNNQVATISRTGNTWTLSCNGAISKNISDLNDLQSLESDRFIIERWTSSTVNYPSLTGAGDGLCFHYGYGSYGVQFAIGRGVEKICSRYYSQGAWSAWRVLV